jgi:hypothetical protein
VAAHRTELVDPEAGDGTRILGRRAYDRPRQVGVVLPVVERPERRQLDDRARVRLKHVRAVAVYQARVVLQAVLDE